MNISIVDRWAENYIQLFMSCVRKLAELVSRCLCRRPSLRIEVFLLLWLDGDEDSLEIISYSLSRNRYLASVFRHPYSLPAGTPLPVHFAKTGD